jgi:hypothetical protein
MLTCLPLGKDRVRITDRGPHIGNSWETWYIHYNPVLNKVDPSVRHVEYQLLTNISTLEKLLEKYPMARIVNTLSHEPLLTVGETKMIMGQLKTIQEIAAWKRVKMAGEEIIDEFGFHVYIRSDIDFSGAQQDTDLRY